MSDLVYNFFSTYVLDLEIVTDHSILTVIQQIL